MVKVLGFLVDVLAFFFFVYDDRVGEGRGGGLCAHEDRLGSPAWVIEPEVYRLVREYNNSYRSGYLFC